MLEQHPTKLAGQSPPDYRQIDFVGCSPLVCCVLSGSSKCLKALKVHLGDDDFMSRSAIPGRLCLHAAISDDCLYLYCYYGADCLGLLPLPTLCHVLRIQNDHVGRGASGGLWTNLMQAAAEVVNKCNAPISKGVDMHEKGARGGSGTASDILSPMSKKLLLYSNTAFADTTSWNDTPSYQRDSREGGVSPRRAGTPGRFTSTPIRTPRKRALEDSFVYSKSGSPSKGRLRTPLTPSSPVARPRTPRSVGKGRRGMEFDAKSFTLHKVETSFAMQGIRYNIDVVEEILHLLTDCSGLDETSTAWDSISKALAMNQVVPLSTVLRKRLARVCQELHASAFPNYLSSRATLRFNDTSGSRYFDLSSGKVVASSNDRIILLVAGAAVSAVDPASGKISDAVPKGYIVEDLRASLTSKFPELPDVVAHIRAKRMRWSGVYKDNGGSSSDMMTGGERTHKFLRSPYCNRVLR